DGRFADVSTTETLVRPWDVDGLAVRPAHRMVAHTAFLTTARRVPRREEGGPLRRRRKVDTGGHVDWEATDRSRHLAGDPSAIAGGDHRDDGDPDDPR
ncbi:MAG: tRNA (adenine-N1)-methyltransferase, partial [Nitriliruptoraceae bacterium]